MLTFEQLANFSTKELKRRLDLHRLALGVVWLGAGFAFGVGLAKLQNGDPEVYRMLIVSGLALLASIPVYRQKQRIKAALGER